MDWPSLVDRVINGEEAAAAELVSALAAQLDLYARMLDESNQLSTLERETAVEQAMVKVARRIRSYDPARATLPTWARGFVRNEMREALRSRREIAAGDGLNDVLARSRAHDEQLLTEGVAGGHDPSPREVAILALLLLLPSGDAELLYAHSVEGLQFQAIADRLGGGVTAAALRKRYQRARTLIVEAAKTDENLKHLTEEHDEQRE